jgi:hypothetical protein
VSTNKRTERQAKRIADAIVDLVERTDGPVTFARIAREISGFAKVEPPARVFELVDSDERKVIWGGLTEAGHAALRKVMCGRRVAVQHVSSEFYLRDRCCLPDKDWLPTVLLPVRAANLDTPNWRVRCSQRLRDYCVTTAAKEGKPGFRALTPAGVCRTADAFSV